MGRKQLVSNSSKEAETMHLETHDDFAAKETEEETLHIESEEMVLNKDIDELNFKIETNQKPTMGDTSTVNDDEQYQSLRIKDYQNFVPTEESNIVWKKNKSKRSPQVSFPPRFINSGKDLKVTNSKSKVASDINPFTYLNVISTSGVLEDQKSFQVISDIVRFWQIEYRKRINLETRLVNRSRDLGQNYVKFLEGLVEEWMMRYECEKLRQNNLDRLSNDNELLAEYLKKFNKL
eukprot:NODE_21_length_42443_cov_0.822808.p23 type:complete len:235 gc:universal NODE_21_length_42443_cov_0.822808:18088-18792(+)